MRQILTLILILTLTAKMFACECPEYNLKELDKISYEWSDVVLVGEIKRTGTNYEVNVKEILKGTLDENIITGRTTGDDEVFNTCTFYPPGKGEYLLYLKKIIIEGRTFYYSSQCLGSRLLNLEYSPVSLYTEKSKSEIIAETYEWINKLREEK